MGDRPLGLVYPALYNLVRKKNTTVAHVLGTRPLNVSFRRGLVNENLTNWHKLVALVALINLTDERDTFRWDLNKNGLFTVKSMYLAMIQQEVVSCMSLIWKIKVPLKIKVFLWFLNNGVTLTKDNLAKRMWQGDTKCCFCSNL